MNLFKRIAFLILVFFTVLACEDSTTTKNITSKGGEVNGNGATILIPQGAIDKEVSIEIKKDDTQAPDKKLVSDVFKFEPVGTVFEKPVAITLPYDSRKVSNADNLKIHLLQNQSQQWKALESKIDKQNETVEATVNELSFAVIVEEDDTEEDTRSTDETNPDKTDTNTVDTQTEKDNPNSTDENDTDTTDTETDLCKYTCTSEAVCSDGGTVVAGKCNTANTVCCQQTTTPNPQCQTSCMEQKNAICCDAPDKCNVEGCEPACGSADVDTYPPMTGSIWSQEKGCCIGKTDDMNYGKCVCPKGDDLGNIQLTWSTDKNCCSYAEQCYTSETDIVFNAFYTCPNSPALCHPVCNVGSWNKTTFQCE